MAGLESIFKLSLIMNMVDNLTGPMSHVSSDVGESVSNLQSMEQTLAGMTKGGAALAGVGMQITSAALAPVEATFETRKALGELSSLGVKDLEALETASRSFSDTWAGTTKADFITAAYDIKSGIASLTDEGVAGYTEIAGLTAKTTKASVGEMTSLFATGYGIYKQYYDDMSDVEFAEMFSAGIADSVRAFKTSGSGMAQAIQSLGASATSANVPLEEQLAIVGMLQATMSGPEAGTKYKAFLRTAVKGGQELGLSFTDANNQLRSLPEILEQLRGKFGDTIDAVEKRKIQKAFGDTESIQFIDLLYNKTGELQDSILGLYGSMGEGIDVATRMASAINETEPDRYQRLQQRIQNVKETIGNSLLPTVNDLLGKGEEVLVKVGAWIENNQELVRIIMIAALALGGFITVAGTTIAVVGGIGLIFTKGIGQIKGFVGILGKIPGAIDTVRLCGMYAGDGIKAGFSAIGRGGTAIANGVKDVGTNIRIMGMYAADGIKAGFNGIKAAGATAINSMKGAAISIGSMAKTAAVTGATAVKNLAISIGTMAKSAAIAGVNGLKSMALGLAGMAKQAVTTAVTAMPGLISSVWGFTAALLANPITWIVIAIIALVVAVVLLYNKCEWFRNAVNAVWGAIKSGVMAVWNVVKNIFGNMKSAFEKHGGGLKGIAAAALEGIKGIFSAGFNFIDNLTGGKLTDIRNKFSEKFDGIKGTVATALEASKQYAASKLTEMQATFQEQGGGIRGAAAATMTGIKSVFQDGYNVIDTLTGGKLSSIRTKFSEGIQGIQSAISEKFQAFKDSGRKLIETFTEGIKSAISAPVDAVKGGLAKIRELLPFSDAKTGPLSTLTLSGQRTMSTLATGIQQAGALPQQAVEASLQGVGAALQFDPDSADRIIQGSDIRSTRETVKQVQLREITREQREKETITSTTSEKESGLHIENFNVDFSKLKELPLLIKLLRELEDYANANGLAIAEEG